MSLLATRRSTLRARGIARREQLLNSARALLQEREMDDISLGDVAEHAGVPKGSAYHFYADIRDLYVSLLADIQKELQQGLGSPIKHRVNTWQDVVEILIDRGVKLYRGNRAARQLQIGPKTPPEWASSRIGDGPGRRIGASCITAHPATLPASRGIRRGNRFGGARTPSSGSGTTYPISKPIRIPRTTWVHSL